MKSFKGFEIGLAVFLVIITAGMASGAMVDYFLKIDGIPGGMRNTRARLRF